MYIKYNRKSKLIVIVELYCRYLLSVYDKKCKNKRYFNNCCAFSMLLIHVFCFITADVTLANLSGKSQ